MNHHTEIQSLVRSPRGRLADGQPNPVDVHVGKRVRLRRILLGMSQDKLGAMLGVTFQQVQKYERGANRIGASRLYDLSIVLKCPISYFYEDLGVSAEASPRLLKHADIEPISMSAGEDPIVSREAHDLLKAFNTITDDNVRRRIANLVHTVVTTVNEAAPAYEPT